MIHQLTLALVGFFLIEVIRAVLTARIRAVKPWSCDLCMSWWWAVFRYWVLVLGAEIHGGSMPPLKEALASAGITLILLAFYHWMSPPLPPPD